MKTCVVPFVALGLAFLMSGCATKVYNQQPAARDTTVIEKDRPVVTEKVVERPYIERSQPDVQNNIRVEK